MSKESHERYLERAAVREAQKAIARQGREAFREHDFRRLRIQTISPWSRLGLALYGVVFAGIGIFVAASHHVVAGLVILGLAGLCLIVSIIGKRDTVENSLAVADVLSLFASLF